MLFYSPNKFHSCLNIYDKMNTFLYEVLAVFYNLYINILIFFSNLYIVLGILDLVFSWRYGIVNNE